MGIFGSISEAIFGRRAQPRAPQVQATNQSTTASPGVGGQWWRQAAEQANQAATQAQATQTVSETDVVATLEQKAATRGEPLNWRTSIVDLMKLLEIDPSLENRRELARELGYTGDTNDTATMNTWLHKQVMRELAANGGRVPAELTD